MTNTIEYVRRIQAIKRVSNTKYTTQRGIKGLMLVGSRKIATNSYVLVELNGEYPEFELTSVENTRIEMIMKDVDYVNDRSKKEYQIDYELVRLLTKTTECVNIELALFDPKLVKDALDIMGKDAWFCIRNGTVFTSLSMMVCVNEIGKCVVLPYRGYYDPKKYPNVEKAERTKTL